MSFYESTIFLYNSLFINRIINTIKIICEKWGLTITCKWFGIRQYANVSATGL